MRENPPDFENDPSLTEKQKRRRREYYAQRDKSIAQSAAWVAKYPDRYRALAKKSKDKHRDSIRAKGRAYQKQRRVTEPDAVRAWYWKDRDRILTERAELVQFLKREVLDAYGAVCACCGESEVEFLCLDHIHNDGAEERRRKDGSGLPFYKRLKRDGYPQGRLQVLCHNCNMAKGLYGYCPHQKHKAHLFGLAFVPLATRRIRRSKEHADIALVKSRAARIAS